MSQSARRQAPFEVREAAWGEGAGGTLPVPPTPESGERRRPAAHQGRQNKEITMKKNSQHTSNRILGRRLARELPKALLSRAASGEAMTGVWTYTLLYPSDPGGPTWDGGSVGPILT
jgi:hypothetical protein